MSLPVAVPTHLTRAEYLAWERKASFKNEYLNGEIIAMPGASQAHNRITVNLIRRFGNLLDVLKYSLYVGDLRFRIRLKTDEEFRPRAILVHQTD